MIKKTTFQMTEKKEEIFQEKGRQVRCLFTDRMNYCGGIFPWHWHSAFEVDYATGSRVCFEAAGEAYEAEEGDAVFFNSGEIHSFQPHTPEKCKNYAILFEPSSLAGGLDEEIFQKYIAPALRSQVRTIWFQEKREEDRKALGHIRRILELSKKEEDYYELEMQSELTRLWVEILKRIRDEHTRQEKEHDTKKSADGERIKSMLAYIHQSYQNQITLENIAEAGMIGCRECTRCFQRMIGQPPITYLNAYRVRMAAMQLLTTEQSITQISENCGFSTAGYFGKVFRQCMGQTPLEYRRNGKKQNAERPF